MGDSDWWRRAFGWLVATGVAVSFAGCATQDGGEGKPEGKARAALVGRVASVPKDQDFVLLQSYGAWSVPPGTPVFSAGPDGRLANLLPTGEKMGQFLAADLRDGEVRVGDAVYYRSDGRKPAKPAGDAPPAEGGTDPNKVPDAVPDAAPELPPDPADPAPGGSAEPELPR